MKSLREMMDLVDGKVNEGRHENEIDQKIIDLLIAGIPPEEIATELNIPVEWVDEVAEYQMPKSEPDFTDPRNREPDNRFGESVSEEATPEAVEQINKLYQDKQ
jgi:hypothetical protein